MFDIITNPKYQIGKNKNKDTESGDESVDEYGLWQTGTRNPDNKLALIHAANTDFQAKLTVCLYTSTI